MPKPEPAGYLQLKRSISFEVGVPGSRRYRFYRGTPEPIDCEHDYNHLIKTKYVYDPYKTIHEIAPATLQKLRPGQEVLIIRDIGLGDIIIVAAVVRELVKVYPHLKFSFATNSNHRALFDDCPWCHEHFQISRMRGTWNAALDLRGFAERSSLKLEVDRIDIYAKNLLGRTLAEYDLELPHLKPEENRRGFDIIKGVPGPRVIMTVSSVTTGMRSYPPDQVKEAIAALRQADYSVVLVHPDRVEWDCDLNLTGALDVRQLAAVVKAADAVVTPDTGLVHLSEGMHTPHVDLFSTWRPELRTSHYKHAFPIFKADQFGGCPCYDRRPTCPHLQCFRAIGAAEIVERVMEAIARGVNCDVYAQEKEVPA